jgi:hypothetical protein
MTYTGAAAKGDQPRLTRRAKHLHDGIIGRLRLISQNSDVFARRISQSRD